MKMVINFFKNRDFIKKDLKIDLNIDLKVDLKKKILFNLKYNFCKYYIY